MDSGFKAIALSENGSSPAAQSQIESAVAGIWQSLLGIDHVGVDDNFLLLGGESLAATQAASRIKERFGWEPSLRSILVGTVMEVAAEIYAQMGEGQNAADDTQGRI